MFVAVWMVGAIASMMVRAVLWSIGFLWGLVERFLVPRRGEEPPEDRTVAERPEPDITAGSRLAA
jgi:hypothetical protein